jgi:hypothetical protein
MNKYYESKEFRNGFDAAASCEPCDKTQSKEWIEGWNYYEDKMTTSESACWF